MLSMPSFNVMQYDWVQDSAWMALLQQFIISKNTMITPPTPPITARFHSLQILPLSYDETEGEGLQF